MWGATVDNLLAKVSPVVSIHAPRVGCDVVLTGEEAPVKTFQFTHPVWGATPGYLLGYYQGQVSIHAPRVGCDVENLMSSLYRAIVSIHAPRVGCDW